jgi:DNA-binding MarR family transcriptional regulator
MPNIDILTNKTYIVLAYLYDNKDEENLIKITQTELSETLGINRTLMNSIFKILSDNEYLIQDKTRIGRYYLTDYAIEVVKNLKKLNTDIK